MSIHFRLQQPFFGMQGLRRFAGRIAVVAAVLSAGLGPACAATPFEVRVVGQGPDVLLIPGLASSGDVWNATVDQLARNHRCHVFTLAGFAGVPPQPGPLLDRVDAAMADYITQNRLQAPVVVGHSLGGFVALRLAIGHPADVGRLVIVDALPALGAQTMDGLTPTQLRDFEPKLRAQLLAQDPATYSTFQAQQISSMVTAAADVALVREWGRRSDRVTVIEAMTDMLGYDLRPALSRVKAPTLVMAAANADKSGTSEADVQALYERQYRTLQGVRIVFDPKARHFIMMDDPAWFEATLVAFIG